MRQASINITSGGIPIVGTTLTANFNSDGYFLSSAYAYSMQIGWSGAGPLVGVFSLQGSDDSGDEGTGQGVVQPTVWTTIGHSCTPITTTPDTLLYDVTACSYRWVRLVYTATSGTATITSALLQTKGT